ncbi:hypothetical protein ACFQWB_05205 [Paenibacillus thermoaerophilus]|uniref:Uncharacterized protein n=1 Tax=Paenibacillus thermoaerophilus TaxID=1215385 RepID=A0ABW2UZL4_9BACL|nr:hypothetical protein [Paenibacillus thermoaerophilus]TMV14335.1 hypothetical protein FE781_10445 [Paenibacillus thermoaerophilus]
MERIVLLAVAFVMGYLLIDIPMPEILKLDFIGNILENISGFVGLAMMIYSAAEIVMSLIDLRRGGSGKK